MRVLGVDPGTANCGFALLDAGSLQPVVRDLGTFRSGKDGLLRERIAEFVGDLLRLVDESKPHVIVAEAPAFPRGAKAAVMVWSAFTGLTAICQARGIELVLRNPGEWRRMLALPERKVPPAAKAAKGGLRRGLCKCGGQARAGKTTCSRCAERAKLARQAQEERKADTEQLMKARWPGAPALLASCPDDALEHAYDALAIATTWLDRAKAPPGATVIVTRPVVQGAFNLED